MKRVLLFLASLIVAGAPSPLQAQAPHFRAFCASHDRALEYLQLRYGERRVAVGLINERAILEILATRTRSTWSVLMTGADGKSCLVAFGNDLTALPVPAVIEPMQGTAASD